MHCFHLHKFFIPQEIDTMEKDMEQVQEKIARWIILRQNVLSMKLEGSGWWLY